MRPKAEPKSKVPVVPEAELAAMFEAGLRLLGPDVLWYHTHDSRRSRPGFPDYFVVVGRNAYAIELKRTGGRASADQVAWLEALDGAVCSSWLVEGPDALVDVLGMVAEARRSKRPGP